MYSSRFVAVRPLKIRAIRVYWYHYAAYYKTYR